VKHKAITLGVVGVAAFAATLVILQTGKADAPEQVDPVAVSVVRKDIPAAVVLATPPPQSAVATPVEAPDDPPTTPDDTLIRLARITGQVPPNFQRQLEELQMQAKFRRENGSALNNQRLLAAGFSQERINWILQRSEELRKERDNRSPDAPFDHDMALAYSRDSDLDLRDELGLEEYEKYRQALGRPPGIGVGDVPAGSLLGNAGVRTGDQIVGYAGKRIFNLGELNALAAKGPAGESVTMDILRDGISLEVTLPRERLGVRQLPSQQGDTLDFVGPPEDP